MLFCCLDIWYEPCVEGMLTSWWLENEARTESQDPLQVSTLMMGNLPLDPSSGMLYHLPVAYTGA